MACLLFACGKSERDAPTPTNEEAGTNTGGTATASSGTANSAGSLASNGGQVALGGGPASAGTPSTAGGAETEPEGGATSAGGEPSVGGASSSCDTTYRACGCGCCSGQTPSVKCVYPDRRQDLASIIAADMMKSHDTVGCAAAGCSPGIDYVCCQSPPPSTEQASYTAALLIGGIDRLRIDKMTTACSTLTLSQSVPSDALDPSLPLTTPAGWKLERANSLPCTSSAIGPNAIGAIGQVGLRVVGNGCVVDVHAALFFGDAAKGVDAVRFDADALPINLSVDRCH